MSFTLASIDGDEIPDGELRAVGTDLFCFWLDGGPGDDRVVTSTFGFLTVRTLRAGRPRFSSS